MAKISIKTIREAVILNRGGFENATNAQIMTIWNALDEPTRRAYLENLKAQEKKGKESNADNSKSQGDL